jgi:hypothetical protein
LSHWVHTAIGEGPDLPALTCSSHWSLGLYLATVDSLRAIRCDFETKCMWSTPAHVHPSHAHTAGGAAPVSTSSESVSTTNGVTRRRHDSRVTAAAATLSTCIDRLESVLERGLAFDTNAFASTQVTRHPLTFRVRMRTQMDGRTRVHTHTHTHTHLITLTATCSLAHPLPLAHSLTHCHLLTRSPTATCSLAHPLPLAHSLTHCHLLTRSPTVTCPLAHPLPGAAHTANTPSKT